MKRSLALAVMMAACTVAVYAQGRPGQASGGEIKGAISGKVIEFKTGTPIEYANVVVYKIADSSMINGSISGPDGKFRVDKLPFGKYYVKVNFIGFAPFVLENIVINADSAEMNIGIVKLKSTTENLSEVEIKGQKDEIEYNLDKKVINVDKNLVTAGGTAIDVMQTIPSVSVDVEGTVSLRGSSNVTILIDGRPSGLTSLDQIPASMIDKIEIVTNPSARYDPDGMSGIINIVTKKKKEPGYNGMVTLNAGTGDKYTGSVNLNYRHNKVNIFTNYDFRFFSMKGSSDLHRESTFNDTTTLLDQFQDWRRRGRFQSVKAGLDYYINDKNTISFTAAWKFRKFFMNEYTDYNSYDHAGLMSDYYYRNTDGSNEASEPEAGIDYRRTFKRKNQELSASIFYNEDRGGNTADMLNQYLVFNYLTSAYPSTLQQTATDDFNRSINGQADYIQPLGDAGRIETGVKSIFRNIDNDYRLRNLDNNSGEWSDDTSSSNHFLYSEQIHAAYAIYSNSIGSFQYQGGLRGEYAVTSFNQKTMGQEYKNDYLSIFPTIHLKYGFTETNAIQLSYSRRVNRPSRRVLNPFINNTDPLNLSAGNPFLKPEYTNSIELAYLLEMKTTSLNATLFYRQTDDIISRTTTVLDSNVLFSTYSNLNKGQSYGLEFILTQNIFKWWKVNANLSVFGQKFDGEELSNAFTDATYSWTGRATSSMALSKNAALQISFNYASPVTSLGAPSWGPMGGTQGKQKENYFMDAGMKYDLFKNALSLSLRVSDIFKTMKYEIETSGNGFSQNNIRVRESRVVFFGITYKINGGVKQKRKKPSDDQSPDDMGF